MLRTEQPHPREQPIVGGDVGLEVRGGDDDQPLRVPREHLTASLRSLEVSEQTPDRVEVRIRVAFVPGAQGQ